MIDRKWLAAGAAAAVLSIVIVVILFGLLIATGHGGEEADQETATGWEAAPGAGEGHTDAYSDEENSEAAITDEEKEAYDAGIAALEGDALWSEFDGAVLTGDSRVVGFSLYTGIPRDRVFAQNGATIMALDGYISGIAALSPDRVYIAYGINDIKSAVGGNTAEKYAEYAKERIRELEEALDGADIYVNSILPVSPSLENRDTEYRKVYEYNEQLREMCLSCGWHYVDNSELALEHGDLYVSDGIHLTAGFYEYWARNMLMAGPGFGEMEE